MSRRDLALAVGISTGSVHYVLKVLVDKGLVNLGNFTISEDKRRYAYLLTPKSVATKTAMTRNFLVRKLKEYKVLKAEISELSNELNLPRKR